MMYGRNADTYEHAQASAYARPLPEELIMTLPPYRHGRQHGLTHEDAMDHARAHIEAHVRAVMRGVRRRNDWEEQRLRALDMVASLAHMEGGGGGVIRGSGGRGRGGGRGQGQAKHAPRSNSVSN